MSDQLAKAKIHTVEGKEQLAVVCMFNPKEYAFSKKNSWNPSKNKGGNMAEFEFGGGEPATLTLKLIFDTFETGQDVRLVYTNKVWQLMLVDPNLKDHTTQKGRPPKVRFQWGRAWSFDAVITSITQTFTLFKEDGTPVRATLDVGFQQVVDELYKPRQDATSTGLDGAREWTVKAGDSLASIAHAEYGDPNAWRPIAEANRIDNPRRLQPGTTLAIPSQAEVPAAPTAGNRPDSVRRSEPGVPLPIPGLADKPSSPTPETLANTLLRRAQDELPRSW